MLTFMAGDVVVDCHFFRPSDIEFSFAPGEVTEQGLRALLVFMVELGDALKKRVIMTPENRPQYPIFGYDSHGQELVWFAPDLLTDSTD